MSSNCVKCGEPGVVKVDGSPYCGHCVSKNEVLAFGYRIMLATQKPTQQLDKCPNCGWTRAKIEGDGVLGCPACYDVFAECVDEMLR